MGRCAPDLMMGQREGWVIDRSMMTPGARDAYDRAVNRLVDGTATPVRPQGWEFDSRRGRWVSPAGGTIPGDERGIFLRVQEWITVGEGRQFVAAVPSYSGPTSDEGYWWALAQLFSEDLDVRLVPLLPAIALEAVALGEMGENPAPMWGTEAEAAEMRERLLAALR